MRRYHRWIGSVVALFMAYLAITGVVIQSDGIAALVAPSAANAREIAAMREGPAGPQNFTNMPAPSAFATALPSAGLQPLLATALAAARKAEPTRAIQAVELRVISGQPQAVFTFAGEPAEMAFALDTGQLLSHPYFPGDQTGAGAFPEPGASFYGRVKALHELAPLGDAGIWFDLVLGLTLLGLTVTGAVVYFSMQVRRRRGGGSVWFWR